VTRRHLSTTDYSNFHSKLLPLAFALIKHNLKKFRSRETQWLGKNSVAFRMRVDRVAGDEDIIKIREPLSAQLIQRY
jgi:hypothetical protein